MDTMNPTAAASAAAAPPQASPSQTLSRGIRALEILAAAQNPLTIAELADAMGVHRSVAYRILRTLEDHSLLVRDDAGRVQPGPGLAVLARGVSRNLQTAALPELTQLANSLDMTAQHPGTRHPINAGAPGIAIQSALTEDEWKLLAPGIPYRPEAEAARRAGYSASHDEVIAGVSSLAAPVRVPGGRPAALAVVYIRSAHDPAVVGAALAASAARIERQLA